MIIGFVSFLLDYIFLLAFNNQVNNVIIFPLFSLIFIFTSFNIKQSIALLLLYSCIIGVIFLPLSIFMLDYYLKRKEIIKNPFIRITILLFIYDSLFYLLLSLSDISLLINKIFITIPVNLLYAYILNRIFLSSKNKKILV